MRTPEEIADEIKIEVSKSEGMCSTLRSSLLRDAMRALRAIPTAPTFKPEGEPDEYRDRWAKIEVAPDFLADLYVLKISAHQTRSGDSASTGSLRITWQQARRILEMLSSEDTGR